MEKKQMYMNIFTGAVGTYDEWWLEDNSNAVDSGDVVPVAWNKEKECWE